MRRVFLAVLAACGSSASHPVDAPADHALAMSDVSILLPLPADPVTPVLTDLAGGGTPLVDPDWFDALVVNPRDLGPKSGQAIARRQFQVVALRFDLCDRSTVGVCPPDVDGRLRLVLQPVVAGASGTTTYDVAAHLFYPIPAADLASVVAELRALAQIQDAPADAPLGVSVAAMAGNAEYLDRLRALVLHYAQWTNLVRITTAGQNAESAAFAWIFRGLDRDGESYQQIVIPTIDAIQQKTLIAGGDIIFNSDPVADAPVGFATAIDGVLFDAATADQQRTALGALTQLQNPLLHDAVDTQCMACHVATNLTFHRAMEMSIDPATVAGRYGSTHDLSVDSVLMRDGRVIRAFGWIDDQSAISQRVANDTAQVLTEIDARFP